MTQFVWQAEAGVLQFQTELIQGSVRADGARQAVTDLVYRPTGTRIDREMILALYRLLCRSGWMGEARTMPHTASRTDDGIEVVWAPRLGHQVELRARFAICEPGQIDCTIEVTGQAHYPDYEVFVSNYFTTPFRPGGYVGPVRGEQSTAPLQIQPEANKVFRDMYVAFPRDEHAAQLLTDWRWQRGRHFTRFLPARYYGLPVGFYSQCDGPIDVLLMGLPRDVFAVSMAYATTDPTDSVGQHNSLYLSLFGRDLHPGERWQTTVRLTVGAFNRDVRQHQAQYEEFLTTYSAQPGSVEMSM